jgi:dTMP kinase
LIERFNGFAVGDCVPDITFVLDVDASTAESRMQREPRKADRMEQQPAEFYERVREGYRELAAGESERIVMIDGSGDVDQIEKQIWESLSSRFPVLAKILKS